MVWIKAAAAVAASSPPSLWLMSEMFVFYYFCFGSPVGPQKQIRKKKEPAVLGGSCLFGGGFFLAFCSAAPFLLFLSFFMGSLKAVTSQPWLQATAAAFPASSSKIPHWLHNVRETIVWVYLKKAKNETTFCCFPLFQKQISRNMLPLASAISKRRFSFLGFVLLHCSFWGLNDHCHGIPYNPYDFAFHSTTVFHFQLYLVFTVTQTLISAPFSFHLFVPSAFAEFTFLLWKGDRSFIFLANILMQLNVTIVLWCVFHSFRYSA